MAKPWARLEVDWIHHQKFLSLPATAICLWLEGKNYCDRYATDGMIPRQALRTFRFNSRQAVGFLTASCGHKPNGSAYAPLWDVQGTIGFRMHDYLLHNDCRDAVLARIADAEEQKEARRAKNAERQAAFRNARKGVTDRATDPLRNAHVTPVTTTPPETETPPETKETKAAEAAALRPTKELPATARSKRPIYQSDRFVVFEWMLDDLGRMLGSHVDTFDLHSFFDDLSQRSRTTGLVIPRDRAWDWLQAEVLKEAQRRKLPMAGAESSALDLDDVRRQIEQADARVGR